MPILSESNSIVKKPVVKKRAPRKNLPIADMIPVALTYQANNIEIVNLDEGTFTSYKNRGQLTDGEYVTVTLTREQLAGLNTTTFRIKE